MQVDGITNESSAVPAAQATIINKERKQTEAVTAKLIEGVEETPTPRGGFPTGKTLDIPA